IVYATIVEYALFRRIPHFNQTIRSISGGKFKYYFHPQHARVREVIANGEIGEVKYLGAGFNFRIGNNQETNIRMSKEKGGGSIYDIGCYAIHSIRTILQQEPETVHVHATLGS